MSREAVAAVVLAGGGGSEPIGRARGISNKALVKVAGQPVIATVVTALGQAELVDSLVVVTDNDSPVAEAVPSDIPVTAVEGSNFLDTVMAGFAHFHQRDRVLVVTSDLPLLTPEAIDHFVAASLDSGAELCYSIVKADLLEEIDPGGARVAVRLRDGEYSGGNLALLSRGFIEREGARLNQAFVGRKSPVRLARMLGLSFIVRMLLGVLTVEDAVKRACQLLHCEAAAIVSPYPEVGFDLDRPEQIAAAEAFIRHRAGA